MKSSTFPQQQSGNTASELGGGLCKIGLFLLQVHVLMPGGSLERKGSSEDRNAINMENFNWCKISEACEAKKQFPICYPCSRYFVCILVLQHQGKRMSFLSELMNLIKPYRSLWKAIANVSKQLVGIGQKCIERACFIFGHIPTFFKRPQKVKSIRS